MEKKREQELADQEAMRLYREFHAPIPASPREREKPLDKVKSRPGPAAVWNGRNDDKETPPPDQSSCDGVGGGAGADPGNAWPKRASETWGPICGKWR